MTEAALTPVVYVDANLFIYFIEGEERIANRLKPFFELLKARPSLAMTSELTLAEVLAKATPTTRRSYLNLIVWSNLIQLEAVTREVLIDTADYRRVSQKARPDGTKATVKLPDAIHVVTAIRSRCWAFLSGDKRLNLPVGMAAFEPNESDIANLIEGIA